jgi:hypothetical protein
VIAICELRHRVVYVLILFVLQFQRHNRQAVEEEDEINFLVRLAEIEVRAEGDAVLVVLLAGDALARAWLGVIEPEFQPAYLQPVADEQPERRMLQLFAQSAKHLVPRVFAVILSQLLDRLRLSVFQKCPEVVFGDEMFGVRDLALFQHAVFVPAGQVTGNVFLKDEFGRSVAWHENSSQSDTFGEAGAFSTCDTDGGVKNSMITHPPRRVAA